jgi:hypothetical protein
LRDAGGAQIEYDDDSGAGAFSRIDRECGVDSLPASTYFLEVAGFFGNRTLSYDLTVSCAPCTTPNPTATLTPTPTETPTPPLPDSYEPDDAREQAKPIACGATQARSISPEGNRDWMSFTLGAIAAVVIETSGAAGDTTMSLRNRNGVEIEYDDDDGAAAFSRIDRECDVDPLLPGSYFIAVGEYLDNDRLVYGLTLTCTPCTPCPGDCSGDGSVTADELVTGVGVALGTIPLEQCERFERHPDGRVTIDEVVEAIGAARAGCP